jgi:hypothetical protein
LQEVKKSAVKFLSKYGITKDDPDFKEVFGFVYRGSSFALVSPYSLHLLLGLLDAFHMCELGVDWNIFGFATEDVYEIGGNQYEPDRQVC